MLELKNKELLEVEGGFKLSAAFLSAITRGVSVIYEIGQSIGSSFRRIIGGNYCPM